MSKPDFSPGDNIAMKVPPHQYQATIAFYRDVLGFEQLEFESDEVAFAFGDKKLWIDSTPGLSQAELWLEINTDDIEAAKPHLAEHDIIRCDDIEALPEGSTAFWVSSPASIIHLVSRQQAKWG